MATPREIYEAYKIMPNLQEHQLRVAAVAKVVCDNFGVPLDGRSVILAALFHDMGNILKFQLEYFPEFVAGMGIEYWTGVKAEYERKYGADYHGAAVAIARELGFSDEVIAYIGRVSFTKLVEIRDEHRYEQKILNYADMRVGPHGILSLQERLDEAHGRYTKTHPQEVIQGGEYDQLADAARDIEKQVFKECSLRPDDITDASVASVLEQLRGYSIGG